MNFKDGTLVRRRLRRIAAEGDLSLATLEALYVHDGLLRRLARSPSAQIFALHGDPLARSWRGLQPEPALPLLARCPPDEVLPHLQALLAAPAEDAVRTDAHVIGLAPLERIDRQPSTRASVVAHFGTAVETTIDVLFTEFEPFSGDLPGVLGAIEAVPQRALPAELAARVFSLVDPNRYHWDAADLFGLWQMLPLRPPPHEVGAALRAELQARGCTLSSLHRLRTGVFGRSRSSLRAWRKLDPPIALEVVAREVGAALQTWVEAEGGRDEHLSP